MHLCVAAPRSLRSASHLIVPCSTRAAQRITERHRRDGANAEYIRESSSKTISDMQKNFAELKAQQEYATVTSMIKHAREYVSFPSHGLAFCLWRRRVLVPLD